MSATTRQAAAAARAEAVRQPSDRPSQRRTVALAGVQSRDQLPAGWTLDRLPVTTPATVRIAAAGPAAYRFEGMASVTEQPYEMWDAWGPYDEVVHLGAFAATLARADLDVPFVLDHVSSRRMARTGNATSPLHLEEVTTGDTTGLRVLAPSLPADDADVRYIAPKLAAGLIDEMSMRFRIEAGRWSEDYMTYHVHAVDLHRGDVAIVGYGANPYTAGSGLRAQPTTTTAGPRHDQRRENDLSRVMLELALAGVGDLPPAPRT